MPKKTLHKMTTGYVDQVMEEQKDGTFVCTKQEFVAALGDQEFIRAESVVIIEDENGEPVTDYPVDKELPQEIKLVQPNEMAIKKIITDKYKYSLKSEDLEKANKLAEENPCAELSKFPWDGFGFPWNRK